MNDHQGYDPSPVNVLPAAVWLLFLAIFGVEAVLAAAEAGLIGGRAGIGWRLGWQQEYGFSPEVLGWMIDNQHWPLNQLRRFVTYPFLHHSFTHMLIAGVMILALGKFVGEIFGGAFVALVFVGASICGALVYGWIGGSAVWLFGAYPAAYGLVGAFSYVLWRRYEAMGQQQIRAFSMIGMLLGIQLVFGVLFGSDPTWVADVAGFVAGFGLAVMFAPGAMAGFLRRMRRD